MCQDVGRRIQTPQTQVNKYGPKTRAKDHGVDRTVSLAAVVLVSDHTIMLQMVSFGNPQTELSAKDTIYNTIEWWFIRVETIRWPSMFLCYHNYCV